MKNLFHAYLKFSLEFYSLLDMANKFKAEKKPIPKELSQRIETFSKFLEGLSSLCLSSRSVMIPK